MRPLSYTDKIDPADLKSEPTGYKITFPQEGLMALAERLGLNAVDRLEGQFTLQAQGAFVLFRGAFEAEVDQMCVVSLKPFKSSIAEEIALDLVTAEEADHRDEEEDFLDPDSPEYDVLDPDNLVPGEILAQTLSMALDPYPRHPDAVLEAEGQNVSVNEDLQKPDNPFASLKGLVDKS